jgi:hypothetical protein
MKQAPQRGCLILIVAVVATLGVLCLGAVGYWRYVTSVPPFTPPSPAMPKLNGYEVAAKAARAVTEMALLRKLPDPRDDATDDFRALLVPVRPILVKLRTTLRMEWRAPLRLDGTSYSYEYDDFRGCARCFGAERDLARRRGDPGAALQRSLDAMELGSKMARGGGMNVRQVGGDCHAIGFDHVEQIVPLLPAADIPGALARVRRLRRSWPLLSEMWESERITQLAAMTEVFRDFQHASFADQLDRMRSMASHSGSTERWETVRLILTPRTVVLARLDEYFRRQIAESKRPSRRRAPVPVPPDPWSRWFATQQGEDAWRYEFASTQLAILEVALAVRLYRLRHGRYPVNLRAIERRWLPAIPADQWDQLVAYRLKRGKPVIYSLGPDGKDDGGLAANARHLGKTARGDLVFGRLTWQVWRK